MSKTTTTPSSIWTTPGKTQEGKPFDHSVRRQVDEGRWRLELIPAEVTGTARPMKVYRSIGRAQKKLAFCRQWCHSRWRGVSCSARRSSQMNRDTDAF